MSKTLRCALVGCSVIVIVLMPVAVVNSASLSVANRNSVDWKHLISKRASENTHSESANETDTKSEHIGKDGDISRSEAANVNEPNEQADLIQSLNENQDGMQNEDRTIDWETLGGNPIALNEVLTARRRRRSATAVRVAQKLSSSRDQQDTNRPRLKRELYLVNDDDGDDDDDNVSVIGDSDDSQQQDRSLTQQDLANLESLIYQLEEMNRQDDEPEVDRRYVINADDLAYGDDRPASEIEDQPLDLWEAPEDDEDEDNGYGLAYPKDKRSVEPAEMYNTYEIPVETLLTDQTDDEDDNDTDDVPLVYVPVEVYGEEDGFDPTDYDDSDDVSGTERKERELEKRIRALAQYLNTRARKR